MNSKINNLTPQTAEGFEIESKSDFLTGMYLIIRIDDNDLDENALFTIQEDRPDFIMPFNYKRVNGHTELTYKVGSLCKLRYFYGDVSHVEYIALWRGLLSPLLECRDWFMKPCSFILNTDYIYFDKTGNSVVYVYVPSLSLCNGHGAFNEMAAELSQHIKVSDSNLENKVLRAIINDFEPEEFLKMLLDYSQPHARYGTYSPAWEMRDCVAEESRLPDLEYSESERSYSAIGVITEKADAEPEENAIMREQDGRNGKSRRDNSILKVFGDLGRKSKEIKRNGFKNTISGSIPIAASVQPAVIRDTTQETKILTGTASLRCIGGTNFPQVISVDINEGEVFTVGRHDKNAQKKRSSFEFDAKTKAVSRRHAAIERTDTGYNIVDLSSSAGTFVNDRKLPPNTPTVLEQGCRVSFGNQGAEYVWQL